MERWWEYFTSLPFVGGAFLWLNYNKQDKTVCGKVHEGIEDKFQTLIEGQMYVRERLDALNDYVRNHKGG